MLFGYKIPMTQNYAIFQYGEPFSEKIFTEGLN